jgi:Chaperone of endosialidase/Bacterial shufflon protein, N-terminal constant region
MHLRSRLQIALFALLALFSSLKMSAQNVGIGTAAPVYKLHTIGDIYANGGWFRVSGNQGLYWETWGGGFQMTDATWIRTYNDKNIWTGNGLLGAQGGLTIGYGGVTPPVGGAIIAGLTGMGTNAPNQRLSVQGSIEIMDAFDNVLVSRSTAQGRSHQMIGTYMGWDQGAVFLGGYNVNNPSGSYSNANKIMCGGAAGTLPIFATAFNTVSSRSYKRDFEPINYGLSEVMAMQPMKYHYNFEGDSITKKHLGLIAEDVNQIVPEVVAVEDGKCLGMDYSSLVPVLIKAMQEQQAMITAQNAKIAAMEAEMARLGTK